ncbi:hypothetical protein [Halorubrum vacuolatum]|uniref:Uncharacterized protein n=1 Tax=Halorubrum vacuolatum TaxID=63740 RepID=A0A238XK75_HALVU|nr:hypothetical protein [Halorubrum vacuolatum]SNR59082.1 hypothetical protein SAMN06264855_1198 [Halorubrum vacuolatum]
MANTRTRIKNIFESRFDRIITSADGALYPFEAIGIQSAQYLGAESTDPRTSISVSSDGYVVETKN